MRAVAIDPARLYAWAAEPSALGAVELAQECRAPCPVTSRTRRRMKGRRCDFEPAGAPLLLSAELCAELLALIDGTRAGVSAFRLACEILPRARGAAAAGRPLALPHRNVMGRLGMSAPTVVRAMRTLALAGLLRVIRGKWTRLILTGSARGVLTMPRTHLKRSSKEEKTKATSEPREARPPVIRPERLPSISAEHVSELLLEVTGRAPSSRGARRCAFRASRAGYTPRTLAALAAGAAETLRGAQTQSAAGVLGWLSERHKPPAELGLEFRQKSERIGRRLKAWVDAHSKGPRIRYLSAVWNGRRRRLPMGEALVHASQWGYRDVELCRFLVDEARLGHLVPSSQLEFAGRNRHNSGFCEDYPLQPAFLEA
jgi:hypothetical protein